METSFPDEERPLPGPPPHDGGPAVDSAITPVIDLDRQSVLRALGPDDGWGLLPMVVRSFLDDCPAILATMRSSVEAGDTETLRTSAHRLKGAAANIGAVGVAASCLRLETATPHTRPTDLELLAELEAELDRADPFLRDTMLKVR